MVGFHAWIGGFAAQKTRLTHLKPQPNSSYIQLVAYSQQRLGYPRSYKTKNTFTALFLIFTFLDWRLEMERFLSKFQHAFTNSSFSLF